jgi:hypothetical protein
VRNGCSNTADFPEISAQYSRERQGRVKAQSAERSDAEGANFQRATFERSMLDRANLRRADLKRANFVDARLEETDLTDATFEKTMVSPFTLIFVDESWVRKMAPHLMVPEYYHSERYTKRLAEGRTMKQLSGLVARGAIDFGSDDEPDE